MDQLRYKWGEWLWQDLPLPVQSSRLRIYIGARRVWEDDLTGTGIEIGKLLGAEFGGVSHAAGDAADGARQAVNERISAKRHEEEPEPLEGYLVQVYKELSPALRAWLLKRALPESLHSLIDGGPEAEAVMHDALIERSRIRHTPTNNPQT